MVGDTDRNRGEVGPKNDECGEEKPTPAPDGGCLGVTNNQNGSGRNHVSIRWTPTACVQNRKTVDYCQAIKWKRYLCDLYHEFSPLPSPRR